MNNSDTRTSAASKESPDQSPKEPADTGAKAATDDVPKAAGTIVEKSQANTGAKAAEPAPLPSQGPVGPAGSGIEPSASVPGRAKDRVSERIANPEPPRTGPPHDSLEEVLRSRAKNTGRSSPLRHLLDPLATTTESTDDGEPHGVAGGFSGINNWLDSLRSPHAEQLGDKLYAAPSTLKTGWLQRRKERAKAAQSKEQHQLIELAHVEAHREAGDREARAMAHQAQLEAQVLEAAQARLKALEAAHSRAVPEVPGTRAAPVRHPPAAEPGIPARPGQAPPTDPAQLAALVASAKSAIDQQQAAHEPVYVAPYTLPEIGPNPAALPADLRRRLIGGAAALLATVVSITSIDTLSSGTVEALGSNFSLLSLAPTAHLLWPVIFLWSLAAATYSWFPSQRSAVRQRAMGIPFALACVASALWMLSALNSWLLPAFVLAGASCLFLYATVRALNRKTARTRIERLLTDAPVCLMTGFSLVVLASTFASLLQSWGAEWADIWVAVILVPLAGYAAVGLAMTERGRIILAIGFAWGMLWLLVPRAVGTNNSIWIAILAGVAAFVVLLATENRRYQIHHAEHRAARGKATDFS